jgi:hypothetical protein
MERLDSLWTDLTKFDIWVFFENLSKHFKFTKNLTRMMGTLHEDQYTFFIISSSFLHWIRNVSDKGCRVNQNILCSVTFLFRKACRFVDNWENIVEPDRPETRVWGMLIVCWILTATNIHSQYVILIAFPLNGCTRPLQCYVYAYITLLNYVYLWVLLIDRHILRNMMIVALT